VIGASPAGLKPAGMERLEDILDSISGRQGQTSFHIRRNVALKENESILRGQLTLAILVYLRCTFGLTTLWVHTSWLNRPHGGC
jgi:hypothetical protein